MGDSLYKTIKPNGLDEELVKMWNTIAPILSIKYVSGVKEITPQAANMYRYDLYGIFKNIIMVPEEYIYPHIRANGYDSSYNYDSKRLRFLLIDSNILSRYLALFKRRNRRQ